MNETETKPIDRVRALGPDDDLVGALTGSEHLVRGPTSTTSWLLAWLRAAGPRAAMVVGRGPGGTVDLVLALERVGRGPRQVLRTVGFRQGPDSGVRAAGGIERLIDRGGAGLIRHALRERGLPAHGLLLADIPVPGAAPPAGTGSPLVQLQTRWTAQAPIAGLDDPEWERTLFGSKQLRQLNRQLRVMVDERGSVAVTVPVTSTDRRRHLATLIEAKRQASDGRQGRSQIFAPALDRWIPLVVEEATGRRDLSLIQIEIGDGRMPLGRAFGILAGDRLDGLIQTYDPEAAKLGPGRLALRELVALARAGGARTIDFGKTEGDRLPPFATDRVAVSDLYLPLGPVDRLAAPLAPTALQAHRRLRDRLEHDPRLEAARQRLPIGGRTR